LTAGQVLAVVAAFAAIGASVAAADDQYYTPTTPGSPVAGGVAAGNPVQYAPAQTSQPQAVPDNQSPYPTAERWVRRSQRLREASARDAVPKPNAESLPPLPPLELGPAPPQSMEQAAPSQQQYSQPYPPGAAVEFMAQRPTSPAQMPGGTQFRANPEAVPEFGAPPPPEKIKKPSELRKVTQILPYLDYEPDPKIAKDNPCENQCPTPNGEPCKTREGRILDCPKEISLAEGPFQARSFAPSLYTWEASNICYNPLYFEDPQLERYGHTYPFFVQPFVSIGRFTVQAAGLPYQMTINPVCSAVYPLGFFRPGECAPKLIYQIPLNAEAALVEAGSIAGVYFLFPHSAWQ
jgi:hypothetical protein